MTETPLEGCQFAGPVPAAMEKKAGKFRFHLILQAKSRKQLHQAVFKLIYHSASNEWHSKVRWSIDIDPVDLSW